MNKAQREQIARSTLARSKADQTEVSVHSHDLALTRFARGISNQNVDSQNQTISVRAIVGDRTGVAATNRFDEGSLDSVVARAIAMAAFVPSDPVQPALPDGDGIAVAPARAYVEETARADAELRARATDAILAQTEEAGFWCSGYVSNATGGVTIANTSGALASFDGTDAAVNAKVTASDSTGFGERYSTDYAAIDASATGARAVELARASARPHSVAPGDWTVILEPAAFGELLTYLAPHFSAQSFSDGSSFFSGRLGETFFGEAVTIGDDFAHALAPGMPFDYEAQPKARMILVDRGVVRNVVTDSYYAKKLEIPNTGHALPAPNARGPQPLNLVVGSGGGSREELIASTRRGLLVTRFWYIRTVDQKRAIVTGMTRDGTFLIEDGKLAGGVRNMRFNQSIVEALAHATFANDPRRTGGYSYSLVTPSAKIEGFRFTSATEF